MTDLWSTLEAQNPGLGKARAATEIAWAAVTGEAPWPTEKDIAESGGCTSPLPQPLADGRVIAGLYVPPTCTVILTEGDTQQRWELPAGWVTRDIHVAPSGKVVLVLAKNRGRGVMAELDLTSGALREVDAGYLEGIDHTEVAEIFDAEYVGDDDHVVVLIASDNDAHLALYVRKDQGWRETDNAKVSGYSVRSTGQVVVVGRAKDCMSFAVVEDQLAKLSKLDKAFLKTTPADTREILWGHAGVGKDPRVLVGTSAAAKKKAKKPKAGTTPVTRYPAALAPVHATPTEMAARFGEHWQAEKLKPYGRSAGGRVIASPPGSKIVIGNPDGTRVEVDPASGYYFRGVHPRAERALVLTLEGALAVLDLASGAISPPISENVSYADYVALPDGAAIAVSRKGGDTVELHDEPTTGTLGSPLASVPLDGAHCAIAGGDLILVRDGKSKYNGNIERWVIKPEGDGLVCGKETQLVLPGSRCENRPIFPATIAGVGVLVSHGNPRSVFAVR